MKKKLGRYTGIVKRWDHVKGYGFITLLKRERHLAQNRLVFIHKSEIKEDYRALFEDQVVTFDLYAHEESRGMQYKAEDLRQIRSGYKLFSDVCRGSEFQK